VKFQFSNIILFTKDDNKALLLEPLLY